jgi:hypothetical protein
VGTSASGTGTPLASDSNASNTNSTNNINTANASTLIAPDPQGLVMQWWLQEAPLPITRSCLLGGAL